jgi:NitT/TauT family transport system ATP-binding protein
MIVIDAVEHAFGEDEDRIVALADVSLAIEERQFVAVVGPSGCGKSTLLRLIAGLQIPTGGRISIRGKPVTGPTASVGLVFQSPTLLPWANVLDNVLFPLRMLDEYGPHGVERARELLALAGLTGFETRMPDELSGGMQQRVAICRGLIRDPAVLLMDEPFAALDALTREEMGQQLLSLWSQRPKTIVFVTHSVPEAVMLADRVVVLGARPGRIVDDVPVRLPRPRDFRSEADDEFHVCTQRIREHIYGFAPARRQPAETGARRQKVAVGT